MKVRAKFHGAWGWLALAGVVVAWDALNDDTLSSAFRRPALKPITGIPIALAVGTTLLHLYGVLDKRYDPFMWIGRLLRG